jgi:hypothetical protein
MPTPEILTHTNTLFCAPLLEVLNDIFNGLFYDEIG